VHGKTTIAQEIVDWHPEHYYSYTERNPIGACLWTIELDPAPRGTRITWRVALRGGRAQRLAYMLFGARMRHAVAANLNALVAYLQQPSEPAQGS
jgi:hypothetical protein